MASIKESKAHLLYLPQRTCLVETREGGAGDQMRLVSQMDLKTGSHEKSLEELFFEYPVLQESYRDIALLINDGTPYNIIPNDLLSHIPQEDLWLKEVVTPHRTILRTEIKDQSYTLLYSVDSNLYTFCERSFSLHSYCHPVSSLILANGIYTRCHTPQSMLVAVNGEKSNIVYSKEGCLMLANQYTTPKSTDLLYYITALWRQFELLNSDTALILLGDISDEIIQNITPRIKNVHINDYTLWRGHQVSTINTEGFKLPPELYLHLIL